MAIQIKIGQYENDPPRYKTRLIAKGYTQREGIDYNGIFSLVVKFKTIRTIPTLNATYDLEHEQLDIKIVFLNDDLDKKFVCARLKDLLILNFLILFVC